MEAEQRFFDRQLEQIYQPMYASVQRQMERLYTSMLPDTATGADLAWVAGLAGVVRNPYSFEDFINLVKKIVGVWAENLPDLTKRAAMLELYPTPRA